jgi:hypothetical protein
MLLIEMIYGGDNLEIFDWAFSSLDAIIFVIGSAYFCAGSYPICENLNFGNQEQKPLLYKG